MVRRLLVLWVVIFITTMSVANAAELLNQPYVMTLFEAHEMSKQYDAKMRAARMNNDAQQEEIVKAKAAFLPQASVSLYKGQSSTDSQTPGNLGLVNTNHNAYSSHNYGLSIRQSIFNMASYAQYGQAQSEIQRSDAEVSSALSSLMSRVSGAYLDMLLSAENIQYIKTQKSSIEGQLKQAEARYKSGFGTITEISEAQSNLQSSSAKEIEYVNALENAKRALENLTGFYPEHFLSLDPFKLSLSPPQPTQVEDWIQTGLEKNPDILADRYTQRSVSLEIDKNQSGHYPTLDLVASRIDSQSDNNYTIGSKYLTNSIGLQLNIPIYQGGRVNASVRQSVARLEESAAKAEQRQRDVTAAIRKYFNEVVNGIAKITAFTQLVSANDIALQGTQKGFIAGIRTNIDVLNAQDKLFSAKRDLSKERYQLIYNRVLLKQFAGMLNDGDIQEISNTFSLSAPIKSVRSEECKACSGESDWRLSRTLLMP